MVVCIGIDEAALLDLSRIDLGFGNLVKRAALHALLHFIRDCYLY